MLVCGVMCYLSPLFLVLFQKPSVLQLGPEPTTQACALTRNRTGDLVYVQDDVPTH